VGRDGCKGVKCVCGRGPGAILQQLAVRLQDLSAKLQPAVTLLWSTYTGQFHIACTLNAAAAAVLGFQTGLAGLTDYEGAVGVYVGLWPALVSNVSLGDSIGVQFYRKVTFDRFEGWGLGFGVSGGPPTKIFSGGVDVAFNEGIAPKGLGISGAIGLGVLPGGHLRRGDACLEAV